MGDQTKVVTYVVNEKLGTKAVMEDIIFHREAYFLQTNTTEQKRLHQCYNRINATIHKDTITKLHIQ